MTTTSRRTILTGAAALATGGVAAISPAASGNECSYPDLARQFAAAYERFRFQNNRDCARSRQLKERVLEATGLTHDEWPVSADRSSEFDRIWQRIYDECEHVPSDAHGRSIVHQEIFDVVYPLCEKIASLPAHTLADLGLQARALALANFQYWNGDETPDLGLVELVNNVCILAGIEVMPGFEPWPRS
jgi:hypothetical protein